MDALPSPSSRARGRRGSDNWAAIPVPCPDKLLRSTSPRPLRSPRRGGRSALYVTWCVFGSVKVATQSPAPQLASHRRRGRHGRCNETPAASPVQCTRGLRTSVRWLCHAVANKGRLSGTTLDRIGSNAWPQTQRRCHGPASCSANRPPAGTEVRRLSGARMRKQRLRLGHSAGHVDAPLSAAVDLIPFCLLTHARHTLQHHGRYSIHLPCARHRLTLPERTRPCSSFRIEC
jgi:hypothetical protein